MVHFRRRRRFQHHHDRLREYPREHPREHPPIDPLELPQDVDSEKTGREADYLKSLVDTKKKVDVVFADGEKLEGKVRYYDRDCFSVGPSGGGPKIFLRKGSLRYFTEE